RLLDPVAGAAGIELERAKARTAERGEEARVIRSERARLAARRPHADHDIAAARGARALFEHARHLALEALESLELAQPARLAREEPLRRLVGRPLHQAEREVHVTCAHRASRAPWRTRPCRACLWRADRRHRTRPPNPAAPPLPGDRRSRRGCDRASRRSAGRRSARSSRSARSRAARWRAATPPSARRNPRP